MDSFMDKTASRGDWINQHPSKWASLVPLAVVSAGVYAYKDSIWGFVKEKIGQLAYWVEAQAETWRRQQRPDMIIIMRHGQSAANLDDQVYAQLPDNQIPLTELGLQQARDQALALRKYIGKDMKPIFYASSFQRAQETAREVQKQFPESDRLITEPRIREQEWGNLQKFQKHPEKSRQIFAERSLVGRFYFRFETGESPADVYDRVGMFQNSLFQEIDDPRSVSQGGNRRVCVIVSHGMVMRLFMMKYFRLSVEEFDKMPNPHNCEAWVLKRNSVGEYVLHEKLHLPQETL